MGIDGRRVLVVSGPGCGVAARLAGRALVDWDVVTADSSVGASLVLRNAGCDLILVDQSHYEAEGLEGVAWLAGKYPLPVLFLADLEPDVVSRAVDLGVWVWLPRQATLDHPAALAAAAGRSAAYADLRRKYRHASLSLEKCQRQVDGLVSLLWQSGPLDTRKGWYTQRHMLERLDEEIARATRHRTALTVALGEVEAPAPPADAGLAEWTAGEVTRCKRRSDVAGQYGPHGFMLLMAQTRPDGGLTCCLRLQKHLEVRGGEAFGADRPVRASFGLAGLSDQADSPQRLLREAEDSLDAARQGEAGRVVAAAVG